MKNIQIRSYIVRTIFLILFIKGLKFDEPSPYHCYTKMKNIDLNLWYQNLTNEYRNLHLAIPLVIRGSLMSDSLGWSKHLALEDGGLEKSKDNGTYGENVWALYDIKPGFNVSTINPIQDWYNEVYDYSFSAAKYSPRTSNFTQLVWRRTVELGCGVCRSEHSVYVTCRFKPKGNIMGKFQANVLPAQKGNKPKLIAYIMAVIIIVSFIAFLCHQYLLPVVGVGDSED